MIRRGKKEWLTSFWLMALFAVSPFLVYTQIQSYLFHQLTPDDGLSQGSNDFIYCDTQGFVWLSSIDGLNRFDGKEVKIYKSIPGDSTSLLGNIITSHFFEDEHSNLWFTSYEGIHCYIRNKDQFRRFQVKDDKGLPLTQDYHAFYFDKNNHQLWIRGGIGQLGKLYLFDTQDHTYESKYPIDGERNYPILDKEGDLQKIVSFGFDEKKGIEILDLSYPYKINTYLQDSVTVAMIGSIFDVCVDQPSDTWYIGSGNGLVLMDAEQSDYQLIQYFDGQPIGKISSITAFDLNTLIIATLRQGCLFFDKRQKVFTSNIPYALEKKLGLSFKRPNKMYKDSSNTIWITSRFSGVNYTNFNKQKFELPNTFRNERIISIFESKERAVFCSFGNSETIYFSERNTEGIIVPTVLPEGKPPQSILHFVEREHEIWAITGEYVLKWNPELAQFEYVKDLPAYTLYLYKSRNGSIWLTNFLGIFEWKQKNEEIAFEPAYTFKNYHTAQATAVYEDEKKQKYLALDASKIVILNTNGEDVKQIEGVGYVRAFYEEDHFLWVATTTGVLKINTSDLTVEILNEQNGGLPNETYYSIMPDEESNFWLSSNKGIVKYNRTEQTYHRYTLADGLQGNEYNTNAFLKTQDGEIWMGGTNGLNRFYPEQIKSEIPLAKVQFTRLQINDEPAPDSINITMTEKLSLAYRDNTLSFDFVGIDYSDPEQVQLNYQMLGNDEDWIDAGNNGFARYSNLKPGDYTFRVKAANSDGVWNEDIRELDIHIKTPWYQTWWFYLSSLLAVAALVYGIFMYRLQQALKIERMRVKISSDLHDDVGGLLSGLAMQSELLEMTAAEDRKPKLQRISELSRSAMSRMRDTVWAIDARKDKLENLLDRIREHAAETLTTNDIGFDLSVEALALNRNLPTNIRQNLYLICKEAITNAAKHSNGDRVNIQLKKHGRSGIELTIHDNGKVIEKAHKTTGLGMSNMEMRAEEINAQFKVNTIDGFLIKVKLQ